MKLITARVFYNSVDAHLLKTKLESEGVECYIFDEHTVTLDPSANIASGGIKLQILERDTEKVQLLLSKIENNSYSNNSIKCPKCNSENLHSEDNSMIGLKGAFAAIFTLLKLRIPLYFRIIYNCEKCGEEFKSRF